jgi:hypothetical protein
MNPLDTLTLCAFLVAIFKLHEPLDSNCKRLLEKVVQDFNHDTTSAIKGLRKVAKNCILIHESYEKAYDYLWKVSIAKEDVRELPKLHGKTLITLDDETVELENYKIPDQKLELIQQILNSPHEGNEARKLIQMNDDFAPQDWGGISETVKIVIEFLEK